MNKGKEPPQSYLAYSQGAPVHTLHITHIIPLIAHTPVRTHTCSVPFGTFDGLPWAILPQIPSRGLALTPGSWYTAGARHLPVARAAPSTLLFNICCSSRTHVRRVALSSRPEAEEGSCSAKPLARHETFTSVGRSSRQHFEELVSICMWLGLLNGLVSMQSPGCSDQAKT